jgi:hypothetical protein
MDTGSVTVDPGPSSGDVQQYLLVVLTFGSVIASSFATLLFRVCSTLGLARRLGVVAVIFVAWLVWALFSTLVSRILERTSRSRSRAPDAFASWVNNCMMSLTAVFSVFIWFYLSDYLTHSTFVSGISLNEAILITLLAIMLISAIVTFFKQFVMTEAQLIMRTSADGTGRGEKQRRDKD